MHRPYSLHAADNETYLVVARFFDEDAFKHDVNSTVFKWSSDRSAFEVYQEIPSVGARGVESFSFQSEVCDSQRNSILRRNILCAGNLSISFALISSYLPDTDFFFVSDCLP